jgi:hypothetical protein
MAGAAACSRPVFGSNPCDELGFSISRSHCGRLNYSQSPFLLILRCEWPSFNREPTARRIASAPPPLAPG